MKKEAREGYKMTELGEIPSGWKVNKLKNILEVCYGKSQKEVETESGIYKILGTGGVIGYTNEYLWNKPSVLIGRKGTIDKPRYIEEPFWTVDTLFYTKINNENNVKWIYYYLNNIDLKKYNEATGVPSLSVNNLNNIKVITPSLKEQEKIAEILSTVDEQIENTEKLIQKNQELKKGLMQQLLTKGIGHTEFKKTEFGDIPDIWEIKKLSELANVIDSLHETPEYSEQGYPMIRVVDVNGKEINTKYTKFVSKDIFDKFTKKYIPRKNDIIMSRVGSYGQVSYLETDEKVCLGQNTVVITTDFDKKYIFYALSSNYVKNNIEKVTSGSSQKTLSLANIKDLKLLLPRIEEQNKIVAILSSIDEKIDKYQSKKIRLEEIKKGLMQQLLTGKIRVVL
ncbi:restriction endonuclease subunit S [Clostridium perfringens]|nr:restriction endonuclease subunit S [Clostridium perfringens]